MDYVDFLLQHSSPLAPTTGVILWDPFSQTSQGSKQVVFRYSPSLLSSTSNPLVLPQIYSRWLFIAFLYSLPPFPGETPCFLPSYGPLKNSPSSLSPFLSINFRYLETHFIKNLSTIPIRIQKNSLLKWHTTIKLSLVAERATETKEQTPTQQR